MDNKMAKFVAWCKESRLLLVVIAALLLIIVGMALAPSPASALDLNYAWLCREEGLAGATPELVYLAPIDSTNAMRMPGAYMIWEKSGNPVAIRRFYANTAETVWIQIPEGQSLVIPAPPPYKRTGSTAWWHKFAFKGAAGDTIQYLPMDR